MDADKDGEDETWIVLYDETASHLNKNEIEVISKNTMGEELLLGNQDSESIKNATDIDNDGTVESIEVAIHSYNNVIDRINNYCDDLIKIDNLGVRSVGSKPDNPQSRNTSKPYAIQNLDEWSDKTIWGTFGVFGEDADSNSDDDYNQMKTLGIITSGNEKTYCLASRSVTEYWIDSTYGGNVYFNLKYINFSGEIENNYLWHVHSSGAYESVATYYNVRPVVKLEYP